ncbi:MAG TPA: ABC transporter substrate-binding protein, partial [Bacteroidota bacterium]|nr:ABC transporter substrate-binding protein [Bacteroidota bacterium]
FGVDSLVAAGDSAAGPYISVTTLFGPRGYTIAESLRIPIALPDTTAEQTNIPMVTADGIFLALGDPGQLDYVAPQLNYFNIRAQVLGNNEWYDPDRLRDNRESVEGAVFVSDSHTDEGDSAMAAFSLAFAVRSGKKPTKFTLYGYDTMNLLLEQLRAGARTRSEIATRLAAVAGYRGLHSDITLRDGRVNRYLHVLKYSGGAIRRVGSVTVGEP